MKEPDRLSDGADLRAQLLRSARRDAVPAGAKARHVAAAAAAAALLATRPAAGAGAGGGGATAGPVASAGVKTGILKGGIVLAFAVAAAWGTGRDDAGLEAGAPSERRHVVAHQPTPRASAPFQASAIDPALGAPAAPPPAGPLAPSSSTSAPARVAEFPPPSSARLAEEIAQLDRARSRLVQGDGAAALAELRVYHRRFPAPQLDREAALLEIDAREQSGDHEGAAASARAFVRLHPQSPAAKRLSRYE